MNAAAYCVLLGFVSACSAFWSVGGTHSQIVNVLDGSVGFRWHWSKLWFLWLAVPTAQLILDMVFFLTDHSALATACLMGTSIGVAIAFVGSVLTFALPLEASFAVARAVSGICLFLLPTGLLASLALVFGQPGPVQSTVLAEIHSVLAHIFTYGLLGVAVMLGSYHATKPLWLFRNPCIVFGGTVAMLISVPLGSLTWNALLFGIPLVAFGLATGFTYGRQSLSDYPLRYPFLPAIVSFVAVPTVAMAASQISLPSDTIDFTIPMRIILVGTVTMGHVLHLETGR